MNRIQQIFNATWAIERKDYLNLISIIQPSIKAGNFADLEKLLSRDQTSIQAANLSNLAKAWDFYDENLPETPSALSPERHAVQLGIRTHCLVPGRSTTQ